MGFGGFKSAVKKWFDDVGMEGGTPGKDDGKPNKTTAKTAKFIADEYEKAIKKMKTPNGHGPLSYNKSALEKELGPGALQKFDNEAKANMENMNNYSKILYSKFKSDILKI